MDNLQMTAIRLGRNEDATCTLASTIKKHLLFALTLFSFQFVFAQNKD
jgi:hypothetical protein